MSITERWRKGVEWDGGLGRGWGTEGRRERILLLLLLLVLVVVVVVVKEMVLTHRLTFLTTYVTENLETRARNQD